MSKPPGSEEIPDPGQDLDPWVECPECGSSDVSLIRLKSGPVEVYGFVCNNCGADTGSDIDE